MNTPGTFGFYRPWVHRALVRLCIWDGRTQVALCQVDYGVMGLQDLWAPQPFKLSSFGHLLSLVRKGVL